MNRLGLKYTLIVVCLPLALYSLYSFVIDRHVALPIYSSQDEEGQYIQVPPFTLTNQDSTEYAYRPQGGITVVNFFFTSCPTICPSIMRNMQSVQETYLREDKVTLLSMTIDPKRDTPSKMMKFGKRYNVLSEKWQLLTGQQEKIYALARQFYRSDVVSSSGGDSGGYIHSENIVLVDSDGLIRGLYDGTDEKKVKRLIQDLSKLL